MIDTEQPSATSNEPRKYIPKPPRNYDTKWPWAKVREAYATGRETYRTLSVKFGIPHRTIISRAAKDKWTQDRTKLDQSAVDKAVSAVSKRLELRIAPAAEAFVSRSLAETTKWMNRLETAAENGQLDPDSISKLVGSWRNVIQVGRTAHGLDATTGNAVQVNIGHLNEQVIDAEIVGDATP